MTRRQAFAIKAVVVCTVWVLVFNFLVPFMAGTLSSLLPRGMNY